MSDPTPCDIFGHEPKVTGFGTWVCSDCRKPCSPPSQTQDTEALVCLDIQRRQQEGIAKYGTTVADNPLSLREWLQHAYEETLDKAVYLKRAIQELERSGE